MSIKRIGKHLLLNRWRVRRAFPRQALANIEKAIKTSEASHAGQIRFAVEGALEGDPRKIFHAIAFDPLTSAVLSLAETQQMVDEMFQANQAWLPQFKHLR